MGSTGTGSRDQSTQTQMSQSQTQNPWEPTIEPLKALISQLGGQTGNTALTGNETSALDQLMGNAQSSGQYTKPLQDIASNVMGQDRTGVASGAYDAYKQQVQPYLSQDYLDPYKNPAFQSYLNTTTNDIQNRVNGMFAGSGRDMSGANLQTLARGITEGTAPIFANQYNQNVATQRGAQDNLYSAGNSTAGLLSGLDQARLQTASGAADTALNAQNYAPNSILNASAAARSLPLSNIGNVASLLTPLAGLGGTSSGQSSGVANSQMTYKQPLTQTVGQWMDIGNKGLNVATTLFSDRRLKEDIKAVGKLDNGLKVYSFRYKGDPRTVIGLMADDVEKVRPGAVGEAEGFKTVDYERATEAA